jgi:hypothetical protein
MRNMNKNTCKTKHEQYNWRTNMLIYFKKIWLLASTFGFQTVGVHGGCGYPLHQERKIPFLAYTNSKIRKEYGSELQSL